MEEKCRQLKESTVKYSNMLSSISNKFKNNYQVQSTDQIVHNRITSQEYNGRVARKKSPISKVNQKNRLDWAKAHSGRILKH